MEREANQFLRRGVFDDIRHWLLCSIYAKGQDKSALRNAARHLCRPGTFFTDEPNHFMLLRGVC